MNEHAQNFAKGRKGFVGVPLLIRVIDRVRLPDGIGGCWLWIGPLSRTGRGQLWHRGRLAGAHVAVYEYAHGPVEGGLELDHTCRRPACCNPAHMEPVTHQVNMMRAGPWLANSRKTNCLRGHPLSGSNLIDRGVRRECAECKRLRGITRRLAKRARAQL